MAGRPVEERKKGILALQRLRDERSERGKKEAALSSSGPIFPFRSLPFILAERFFIDRTFSAHYLSKPWRTRGGSRWHNTGRVGGGGGCGSVSVARLRPPEIAAGGAFPLDWKRKAKGREGENPPHSSRVNTGGVFFPPIAHSPSLAFFLFFDDVMFFLLAFFAVRFRNQKGKRRGAADGEGEGSTLALEGVASGKQSIEKKSQLGIRKRTLPFHLCFRTLHPGAFTTPPFCRRRLYNLCATVGGRPSFCAWPFCPHPASTAVDPYRSVRANAMISFKPTRHHMNVASSSILCTRPTNPFSSFGVELACVPASRVPSLSPTYLPVGAVAASLSGVTPP